MGPSFVPSVHKADGKTLEKVFSLQYFCLWLRSLCNTFLYFKYLNIKIGELTNFPWLLGGLDIEITCV